MSPSKRLPLVLRRRQALAALLASAASPVLLSACGGGGSDVPGAGGGATASFMSGPIAGLGSIIVGGIRFDDGSARVEDDDGLGRDRRELKLGMMVEIDGSEIDENAGRAVAALIRFGSELKGPVASVSDIAGVQTIRMLDQTVEVRPETVFDPRLVGGFSALQQGQILEVHALFDSANKRYIATRIELEDNTDAYRLRGLVSNLNTADKTFQINDAIIGYGDVDPTTLPANLANNMRVRVRLRVQAGQITGPWRALTVRPGVRRVDDIADARVRGFVTAFTSPQQLEVNGIPVDASNARFEPSADAVRLGVLVEVRGRARSGAIVASRVAVINRGDPDWQRVELHGTVSELDTTAKSFVLREVRVDYSRVLEWKNGRPEDLSNGDALEVKGVWSDDRRKLFAVIVEFE
jgi:hypothetical protein